MWKSPKSGKAKEKGRGKVNESKSEGICSWCNGVIVSCHHPNRASSHLRINTIYELQPIDQQGETKRRFQTGYIPGPHFMQHCLFRSYWVSGSHKLWAALMPCKAEKHSVINKLLSSCDSGAVSVGDCSFTSSVHTARVGLESPKTSTYSKLQGQQLQGFSLVFLPANNVILRVRFHTHQCRKWN